MTIFQHICFILQTTPASIAYQKGHFGIVNLLLTESNIDINFQDDHGKLIVQYYSVLLLGINVNYFN